MEGLLRIIEDLRLRMEKLYANYKKAPKIRIDQSFIEVRLEMLEKIYMDIEIKHKELIINYKESDLKNTTYIKQKTFEVISDFFLTYKTEFKNVLRIYSEVGSIDAVSPPVQSGSVGKLPKVSVPEFRGEYEDWSTFRDLFMSIIHKNKSLDDVQRLQYLKSLVAGEAAQLIKNISITKENYELCWNKLCDRFEDKKFMSTSILKRLLNQQPSSKESSKALKGLLDTTTDCLHELTNLGIKVDNWDIIIIHLMAEKLDASTRKHWELEVSTSEQVLPTFAMFQNFLKTRFKALESIEPDGNTQKPGSTLSCPNCKQEHYLNKCQGFMNKSVHQRRDLVKSLKLCFNCLRSDHLIYECRAKVSCKICSKKHNTLLHLDSKLTSMTVNTQETPCYLDQPEAESHIVNHFSRTSNSQVLLPTAIIKAGAKNGRGQALRALLDQGSQASLITEAAVQLLNLRKIATKSVIAGIGGGRDNNLSRYMVKVNIQSLHDPTYNIPVEAYVLNNLTSTFPDRNFTLLDWPEINELELADPQFNEPGKIDILFGSDIYAKILRDGLIKKPRGNMVAQNTSIGWILSGKIQDEHGLQECPNVANMGRNICENKILKGSQKIEARKSNYEMKSHNPAERACGQRLNIENLHTCDFEKPCRELRIKSKLPNSRYGSYQANDALHHISFNKVRYRPQPTLYYYSTKSRKRCTGKVEDNLVKTPSLRRMDNTLSYCRRYFYKQAGVQLPSCQSTPSKPMYSYELKSFCGAAAAARGDALKFCASIGNSCRTHQRFS